MFIYGSFDRRPSQLKIVNFSKLIWKLLLKTPFYVITTHSLFGCWKINTFKIWAFCRMLIPVPMVISGTSLFQSRWFCYHLIMPFWLIYKKKTIVWRQCYFSQSYFIPMTYANLCPLFHNLYDEFSLCLFLNRN